MQQNDFFISAKTQPHQERCRAILEKHPEITKLIGRNPFTFFILASVVSLQLGIAIWLGKLSFEYWWLSLILAYCVGAVANHNLYVIIHEATHNLIFKKRLLNRLCVVFADFVNIVPGGISFGTYHLKHHTFQGDYFLDADLASNWEAKMVKNIWWRKALWMLFFPVFQVIRSFRVKRANIWHSWMFLNILVTFSIDAALVIFFGWNSLFYLFFSLIFALGLHPLGARWIQEHYTLDPKQETFSYYGILNKVALNVGYHNEHHDFPAVPWNMLPKVRKLAPEFYDSLKYHTSWTKLLFTFIFKPEYSLFSRVKREVTQPVN